MGWWDGFKGWLGEIDEDRYDFIVANGVDPDDLEDFGEGLDSDDDEAGLDEGEDDGDDDV